MTHRLVVSDHARIGKLSSAVRAVKIGAPDTISIQIFLQHWVLIKIAPVETFPLPIKALAYNRVEVIC